MKAVRIKIKKGEKMFHTENTTGIKANCHGCVEADQWFATLFLLGCDVCSLITKWRCYWLKGFLAAGSNLAL